jgi:competence protein ComEA
MEAPPPATAEAPSATRAAQFALAAFLVFLLGLLAYRGYCTGFGARPTETVAARFDLNSADRSELEQIPGVGTKLAQSIVDHRGKKGRFQSLDQLRDVKGVGPATYDKVRPYLRVEPSPPPSPSELDPPVLERKKPPETDNKQPASRPASSRKLRPGDPPLDVNTAPVEQLMQLPGIGPITAQAIVAARVEKPFQTVNDLDRVKGIGRKKLDNLRPWVKVE